MNRTPRWAKRRARRQLAAKVPGLLHVVAVHLQRRFGFVRKVGHIRNRVCMRNASSYCAMRVSNAGSPVVSNCKLVQFVQAIKRLATTRRDRFRRDYSGTAPRLCRAQTNAVILTGQETAAPQPRNQRLPAPLVDTITTKAGRSRFRYPSPYHNHDPMLGRPGNCEPVCIIVTPGP